MKTCLLSGTRIPLSNDTAATAPEPEVVAIPAACRVLGISRTKLYDLLGSGVLPSLKIGRRRLVRLETARNLLTTLERIGLDDTAVTAAPALRSRLSARASASPARQSVSVEHGAETREAR